MKTTLLHIALLLSITLLLSINATGRAQQTVSSPNKIMNSVPCVSRQTPKRVKQLVAPAVVPLFPEPVADFYVGEALVEVTKDQAVVRLAMAQHASVLIELPANDGPRYIIPGDPELVTVDEKALERNKRAIIVRPGALFVVPPPNHKKRMPAATVTAQMRSGLVVTFLFYPVADLAQNVHRCVLSYQRDEVVARRRAAGLPVNLDQKEQGSEKPTEHSGVPSSISVEPVEAAKQDAGDASTTTTVIPKPDDQPKPAEKLKPNALQASTQLATAAHSFSQPPIDALKAQLAQATAEPGLFKNWTRPLHGLALAVLEDGEPKAEFRVLLLAVRNTTPQSLRLIPGTPDLTLEMHDNKGKVINVQSIKPLRTEVSDTSGEIGPGRTVYYAMAYVSPLMGVRHRLKIVVAQTNAADEPASIAVVK